MDTPQHHVFSGMKLLERMGLDESIREFNLALDLEPTHSPAHHGKGLALGYKKDFKLAFESMGNARKHARSKEEQAFAYIGLMRLHTLQKEPGWFEETESNYGNALSRVENLPDAYYYMGLAFKEAFKFGESERSFKKVLVVNKTLVGDADEQLKVVQKIQRAMPGTEVGKKLALQEKISRADCAAIFVHELRLDRLYERERGVTRRQERLPEDIKNHPLETDVKATIGIGVRGLEVFPDGSFRPDEPVIRGAYAMMIEDIISTLKHDLEMTVKHVGAASPFADVQSDEPFFNAILVCTTRGIMEAEDIRTGRFNPKGYVGGADALLIIRKLREELRLF